MIGSVVLNKETRSGREIIAQIPARAGSKRAPNKNMRSLRGRPMISYAIAAARESDYIGRVIVNTDSPEIAEFAISQGAEVYMRPHHLADDAATGDDFTQDFMIRYQTDLLAMVNPVCPLITATIIDQALESFVNSKEADTLISCSETQLPVAVEGNFVNISSTGPLLPTQLNPRVQILNWAVAVWDTRSFLERYQQGSGAYLGHRRLLYPIPPYNSLKVSEEADFQLAEMLLRWSD